ncbi:MAG: Ktr system potassium uptake protein B [Firmicutes bacterium ADurb.Bin262]|nr:MAG: Ktr system potassium uptake protein B [Firmicutes bacterium ADurb.Bin262]
MFDRSKFRLRLNKIRPVRMLVLGYMGIILTGALLLMLPISSRERIFTPFIDTLFTSASATCVTGLVVYDTFTHWSIFGQLVILTLIEIGGLGFMSMAIVIITFTSRKVGFSQRMLMQESIAAPQVGGMVRMARLVIGGSLALEAAGALILATRFIPDLGFARGVYNAVFHSVSAFCNAGYDVLGRAQFGGERSSLTYFNRDPRVLLTVALLIIVGGLGFFVWDDIKTNRLRFRKYRLHSKLVLTTTAFLIAAGTLMILVFEYNAPAFKGMGFFAKLMNAFFQAVTPRTAGFNSVNVTALRESTLFLTIILMLIGGSPGSTAGGVKTTTFAMLVLNVMTVSKKSRTLNAFHRRIDDGVLRSAATITSIYIFLFIFAAMTISAVDGFPILKSLFEAASAIGTVGLSMGITGGLGTLSKLILTFLMYFGRVGCLTILYAIRTKSGAELSKSPLERIAVG